MLLDLTEAGRGKKLTRNPYCLRFIDNFGDPRCFNDLCKLQIFEGLSRISSKILKICLPLVLMDHWTWSDEVSLPWKHRTADEDNGRARQGWDASSDLFFSWRSTQPMQSRNTNLGVGGMPTSPASSDFILRMGTCFEFELQVGSVTFLLAYPLYSSHGTDSAATVAVLWVIPSKW